jgi:hypothetical protein
VTALTPSSVCSATRPHGPAHGRALFLPNALALLKLKPKRPLDWGETVILELACKHPRTGERVEIRQAVRIGRQQGASRLSGGDAAEADSDRSTSHPLS